MGFFKDCGCGCNGKKQEQKFMISLMSALVFFIIANPDTFRLMRSILGSWVASPTGCPTTTGLILHAIVFMFITWGMMNIKRESYAPYESGSNMGAVISVGPSPMKKPTVMVPPRMADMPSPLPGMTEKSLGLGDSGSILGSMDINGDMDLPGVIKKDVGAVTCSCSDGRKVVITP